MPIEQMPKITGLAGFEAIGMAEGNIIESGTKGLSSVYCDSFTEVLNLIV